MGLRLAFGASCGPVEDSFGARKALKVGSLSFPKVRQSRAVATGNHVAGVVKVLR